MGSSLPSPDNEDRGNGGVGRPRPTSTDLIARDHLRRLRQVFAKNPIYFLTCCTAARRPLLGNVKSAKAITDAFQAAPQFHGWAIGRYVIMPDHVHFFARPCLEAKTLSAFMRDLKKWTATKIAEANEMEPPIWQPEFFDHVLRSPSSYSEKWAYVRNNPVRAGLAATPETWPFAGECESLSF